MPRLPPPGADADFFKRALAIAVKNDKTESRFTQLAAQLRLGKAGPADGEQRTAR
jgi:hypothetical protein